MKEYSVIESDSMAELVEGVSELMSEGWECQGGVSIWFEPGRTLTEPSIVHYAQALVRPI